MNDDLVVGIKRGPCVLFLGQRYSSLESGKDAFLEATLRKFGSNSQSGAIDYNTLFDLSLEKDAENWMHRLCERISVPDWLETLALHSWNAVYSSAIDCVWPRVFRSPWRDLERIYRDRYEPRDPRNKFKLHCTFLFGSVDRVEDEERAPLTEFAYQEREEVAIRLAARLPGILTPMGLLFIEGYNGNKDWFSGKRLYAVLNKLNPGQAHMFSARPEDREDKYLAELAKHGKLSFHSESLAQKFLDLSTEGRISLGKLPDDEAGGATIEIEKEIISIPVDLRNRVARSAYILDDSLLTPLPTVSADRLYSEFLRFLSESGLRPLWAGYERGFAFPRRFYNKLASNVRKRLANRAGDEQPVVLNGQTGTGKTIALGALAYATKKERKYAVLFIERRSTLPLYQDIDEFCLWVEKHHCPATLVVWDGMVDAEKYEELNQFLAERGRRAVVVGSAYGSNSTSVDLIDAPAKLGADEFESFVSFLRNLDPLMSQYVAEWQKFADQSFLAALYRLLPTTRRQLGSGVEREVQFAEAELAQLAQTNQGKSITTMELALRKGGFLPSPLDLSQEPVSIAGEAETESTKLTNLVMVPGRFGLRVPIELLLRCMGKQEILHFVDLLRKGRIYSWFDDEEGNITIGPRLQLEAQMLVERRLGGPAGEIEYVEMLVKEIRNADSEIDFTIDLLGQMSDEENQRRYKMFFPRLADVLTYLRDDCGIRNVRLMLKEAHLVRESVSRGDTSLDWTVVDASLRRAEEILREALTMSEDNRLTSQLLAELGINLAIQASSPSKDSLAAVDLYRAAKDELVRARTFYPENAHPVEILSRVVPQMIASNLLKESEKAEAKADLISIFEMCDAEQYTFTHGERYQSTRNEVMDHLGRKDLSNEAFEALKAMGSKAGYYLFAQRIAGEVPRNRALTDEQREQCRKGLDYLKARREEIGSDGRCLYLMVRLWWQYATGKPMFFDERQTVALSSEQWREFLNLIVQLTESGEMYRTAAIRYFEAIAKFHIGQAKQCTEILRDIYISKTAMHKRKTPSYVASDSNGKAMEYYGNVSEISKERGKGKLFVEGLSMYIPFFPQQFNRPEIREQESLKFHIAFNFTGLLADPITLVRVKND
jgi:hypothetical protein